MRRFLLWAGLVLVLASVNLMIVSKERTLAGGETLFLELAPRDPRSLLQGDYMTLRYRIASDALAALPEPSLSGHLVVRPDAQGVARFVRIHDGATPLEPGEHLLQFRQRGRVVRLASDAFFFQEGQGKHYARARFGELRVNAAGEAILVALRDETLRRLAPPGANSGASEP